MFVYKKFWWFLFALLISSTPLLLTFMSSAENLVFGYVIIAVMVVVGFIVGLLPISLLAKSFAAGLSFGVFLLNLLLYSFRLASQLREAGFNRGTGFSLFLGGLGETFAFFILPYLISFSFGFFLYKFLIKRKARRY